MTNSLRDSGRWLHVCLGQCQLSQPWEEWIVCRPLRASARKYPPLTSIHISMARPGVKEQRQKSPRGSSSKYVWKIMQLCGHCFLPTKAEERRVYAFLCEATCSFFVSHTYAQNPGVLFTLQSTHRMPRYARGTSEVWKYLRYGLQVSRWRGLCHLPYFLTHFIQWL